MSTPAAADISLDEALVARVRNLIAEQLGVDEEKVTLEAAFVADLNADSLDLVEMIMALEEAFGFEIPEEAAKQIKTVRDAVTYVQQHSAKK